MIYLNPIDNVRQILRDTGAVFLDQLMVFFSDAVPPELTKYYITWLEKLGEVEYHRENGMIRWRAARSVTEAAETEYRQAFWIIAYFGSQLVRDIHLMRYPFCFEVILESNGTIEVYDIAVCSTSLEGTLAARELQRMRLEHIPDEVVHLVLVPDEAVGQNLESCGFDSFVTLEQRQDETLHFDRKVPQFHQWGETK